MPVEYFHYGASDVLNWQNTQFNQALWKFLAESEGLTLRVVLNEDFDRIMDCCDQWRQIGADEFEEDIPFADYLADWMGIKGPDKPRP